jgi:PAS domain S-box-containing protein
MLRPLTVPRPRRNAVRRYLAVATLVVLLPTYTIVGWLVILAAQAERTQLEANAAKKALEIAGAVDRQATNLMNITKALAHSRFLASANIEEFHQQASELARQLGLQIVLRDVERQRQLVNTAVAWGTPLQSGPSHIGRDFEDLVLRENRPVLSDLFYAPLRRAHVVSAAMAVPSADGQRRVLMVGLEDQRLRTLIERAHLEPEYLVTILDRQRTILARSERHADFVGRRIERADIAGAAQEGAGITVVSAPNLEGAPFRWSSVRTKEAGWTVSVGVPLRVLDAPLATVWEQLALAGAVLALCAGIFNYAFGNYLVRRTGELGVDRPPKREEFETLFESAPYGVLVTDISGRIVLLNQRIAEEFGYQRDELVGRSVDCLVPDRYRSGHTGAREAYLRHPGTRMMGAGRELFGLRKNGTEFPIELALNPFRTSAGSFVVATVVDITARRRAAELLDHARRERERLHMRLLEASDDERRRLSRELHDETGQLLTAVTLSLQSIERSIAQGARPAFARTQALLDQLGKSLHQVAYQLRPRSLDDLDLSEALANHVSEWSVQTGIAADFHCRRRLEALSAQQDAALYRIAQEALTNVARHAHGVSNVAITLDTVDGEVRLTIEDDGCGFDVLAKPAGHGLGLAGMRERLALLGGRLEIEATPRGGTTVYVRMPVESLEVSA